MLRLKSASFKTNLEMSIIVQRPAHLATKDEHQKNRDRQLIVQKEDDVEQIRIGRRFQK